MGLETRCRVTHDGRSSEGKAHLEQDALTFRGEFALNVVLKEVKTVEAARGEMTVAWNGGKAVFALGKDAEKWTLKIRYPRGLLEKLGVKEGMRVAVVGVADADFLSQLRARVTDLAESRPKKESDLIFAAFESKESLAKIAKMAGSLKAAGALWTVYPKGQKHITQADVMSAGKAAGLVDIKVVGLSDTHSSLKWVIPVARRASR